MHELHPRLLLGAAFLVALCGCRQTAGHVDADAPGRRPNIVFIMADDHANRAVSAYPGSLVQTPNIDRLAAEGIRFDDCFCTNALCAPSRAVVLTGKYGHRNGQLDNTRAFDGSQRTFPKLLQAAGYQTALLGKWHLQSAPTGFDYWSVLPEQGDYYNPDFIEMGVTRQFSGYVTDLITDFALDWLKARDPERPFCLLIQHKAPHRNWMPGPGQLTTLRDVEFPLPGTFGDPGVDRSAATREHQLWIERDLELGADLKLVPADQRALADPAFARMTAAQAAEWHAAYAAENAAFHAAPPSGDGLVEWRYQRLLADYLRTIVAVDQNVGRVLDYLDAHGLTDDTIVVYTSDQGFFLGEFGWFDKRFMYEPSLRMPLLVRYPHEVRAGRHSAAFALNLDFAATFLDYAGVPIPADVQGQSLRPVLAGAVPDDWRQAIYYHYLEFPGPHTVKRHYGIRTRDYKLIHFYYDIDAWELYDLRIDPEERVNRYQDPAYAAVVADLERQLEELRQHYGDTDPRMWEPARGVEADHLARGIAPHLAHDASPRYAKGDARILTDGQRFPVHPYWTSFHDGWLGVEGEDLDATLDLGERRRVESVEVAFLEDSFSWIFLPHHVEVLVSVDGRRFTAAGAVDIPIADSDRAPDVQNLEFTVRADARFVRLVARNVRTPPSWHSGAGGPAWLFADEIVVR